MGVEGGEMTLLRVRPIIRDRLEVRREEIEEAALTRSRLISAGSDGDDPQYVEGLRAAVTAAVGFALTVVARGEEDTPPIPTPSLEQARLAARRGISSDTVTRRYFAGYALFVDSLFQEADSAGFHRSLIQAIIREQARIFDCLLAAVTEEHGREAQTRCRTSERHRVERLERLLEGEQVDVRDLGYDFEGHHLGLIVNGPNALEVVCEIAGPLGRRLLTAPQDGSEVWAWLGGGHEFQLQLIEDVTRVCSPDVTIALGEPTEGLLGWRLTHRQARAALPIALQAEGSVVRYADVALVASLRQDDLLASSLHTLYLAPLARGRDGGATLRRTLRTYLASERNVSSAAAALGISRRTVANRLREVETRIGRPLGSMLTEMDAALRLEIGEARTVSAAREKPERRLVQQAHPLPS
jgi:hypothetical protein